MEEILIGRIFLKTLAFEPFRFLVSKISLPSSWCLEFQAFRIRSSSKRQTNTSPRRGRKTRALSTRRKVNEYLMRYQGRLPPMITVEFCPATTNLKVLPPAGVCISTPRLGVGGFAVSDFVCSKRVGILSGFSHTISVECVADGPGF